MRRVVVDTETTGLEPAQGHRVIEAAALELIDRRLTGAAFHHYFDPEREIDEGAARVHGLTYADLASRPKFAEFADDLLAFLDGAELIIHNAPFDLGFLDSELVRCDRPPLSGRQPVVDTLELARRRHPGQRNSLEALCTRYGVDDSRRTVHGARLDAELLAEVYLAMTGGQTHMDLAPAALQRRRPRRESHAALRVVRASEEEIGRHEARLDGIERAAGRACLWRALASGAAGNEDAETSSTGNRDVRSAEAGVDDDRSETAVT